MYSIGIDIGGTFTDFFVLAEDGGITTFKAPTVPADPVRGLIAGLSDIALAFDQPVEALLASTSHIVHGTTVATNAVLAGEGVPTALVATQGFRDALEMRRGYRPRVFDNESAPPVPLVPRSRRHGVRERVNHRGEIEVALSVDEVREVLQTCSDAGVRSVAVSLLFSFLNPSHERLIAQCAEREFPSLYVSLSSDVLPEIGEYERTSTTALNAYVGPIVGRYSARLAGELQSRGFRGTLLLMQSNGGVESIAIARRKPVTAILSGPAAGPSAGSYYADTYGIRNLITIDMGGTSFDACLLKEGTPGLTYEGELAGHRIAIPLVDIHIIGAGGGSVAWLDAAGLLRVGPKSAGAVPGPVCYGGGGTEPTVTDADLVLGYLDPDFFLGGRVKLDRNAATQAIEEKVGAGLGIGALEAAWGIVRVVTASMSDGVSKISVRKGYDPREFTLIVGGGAGPTHGAMIARELGISCILVPRNAAVLCAFGMLASPLKHCYVRTHIIPVNELRRSHAPEIWRELEREAIETLAAEGVAATNVSLTYSAEMRYAGQVCQIEVVLGAADVSDADPARLAGEFHRVHGAIYGYADPRMDVECVNLRLTAVAARPRVRMTPLSYAGRDPGAAQKSRRPVYFGDGFVETSVFLGARVRCGNVIDGPAIIEQQDTTIVVPPGFRAVLDEWGNYQLSTEDLKPEPGR